MNALIGILPNAVLPDAQDCPAQSSQIAVDFSVTGFVGFQLRQPISPSRNRLRRVQRALMPKTSIHENHESTALEYKVGAYGPLRGPYGQMTPPARDAVTPESLGKCDLGAPVATRADRSHHSRPLLTAPSIHEQPPNGASARCPSAAKSAGRASSRRPTFFTAVSRLPLSGPRLSPRVTKMRIFSFHPVFPPCFLRGARQCIFGGASA